MRQYMMGGLVLVGFCMTSQAHAGCPQGQYTFTSCQIEDRNTEVFVCYDNNVASYSYGPIGGAPELSLSETIETVNFEPWSGVGREIGESVTFYNGDYSYEVVGGFEKPTSEADIYRESRHYGWLDVIQNGERLSKLECIPETVTYGFGGGIYDVKVAAGFTWDDQSKIWLPSLISGKPDHMGPPTTMPIMMIEAQRNEKHDCIPLTEFELGGIRMGATTGALGVLGLPQDRQILGADYEIERFSYDGLDIDIFQDFTAQFFSTSPQWVTPSGLQVGLTRDEVIRILGRTPQRRSTTASSYNIAVCTSDPNLVDEWWVSIQFGQDQRVQRISFEVPWP